MTRTPCRIISSEFTAAIEKNKKYQDDAAALSCTSHDDPNVSETGEDCLKQTAALLVQS